jgi:hypothetical protein
MAILLKRRVKKNIDLRLRNQAGPFSVNQISLIKKAALRRGMWFRALSRVERGVLDLTVRYVVSIKSATLASVVMAILNKLKQVTESKVDRMVKSVGFSLARKISALAHKWGNRLALRWAEDAGFARYLVVAHMNVNRLF